MTLAPTEHRYLQVARALRKEIVDGVYPVGSQLPTEHELCERFAVSRYTVREALRRLREDNLVTSRPRAGTLVVPRPEASWRQSKFPTSCRVCPPARHWPSCCGRPDSRFCPSGPPAASCSSA